MTIINTNMIRKYNDSDVDGEGRVSVVFSTLLVPAVDVDVTIVVVSSVVIDATVRFTGRQQRGVMTSAAVSMAPMGTNVVDMMEPLEELKIFCVDMVFMSMS